MLSLKNIVKTYQAGDTSVTALGGVSIDFRRSEFVSILGPSGCGKTTLLNIIGGLDQYTSGDLVIKGRSTRDFNDADWDSYRNHSVGFVFQSYNLIAHQSVLSNVELALTLSGIGKGERRRRAAEALEKVGLGDQLHKKPNQMSGGQMQRVAIARALVNDPEILLADEPTGALDSATSVQIMELLKEIAKDRLVVMVTHNPELAESYSTRIIRVLDGRLVDDSAPYHIEEEAPALTKAEQKKLRLMNKKTSMSFLTALSLSFNNLMTKKARTFLTAFAGSIGIIGIALILSVSTGVQNYINRVQEDTLSSYPITLERESLDMSAMVTSLMNVQTVDTAAQDDGRVYASSVMSDLMDSMNNAEYTSNNLAAFRDYIAETPAFAEHASSIQYAYDVNLNIYTRDRNGEIVKSDVKALFESMYESAGMNMPASASNAMRTYQIWEQLLDGENGELVNPLLYEQYDLLSGRWPESANEVVLVVDKNNQLTDMTLYALGLRTGDELMASMMGDATGADVDTSSLTTSWTYDELCGISFRYILPADSWQEQEDGGFVDLSATQTGLEFLYDSGKAIELKVVGVIRGSEDAVASMLGGAIGYTSALTDEIIEKSEQSALIQRQLDNPETDVLTGLPFEAAADLSGAEKARRFKDHIASLDTAGKAALYRDIALIPDDDAISQSVQQSMAATDADTLNAMLLNAFAQQTGADEKTVQGDHDEKEDETRQAYIVQALTAMMTEQYVEQVKSQLDAQTDEDLAAMLDGMTFTDEQAAAYYDDYMPAAQSDSTYEDNLALLGYVDPDSPSGINLYAANFADKDALAALIDEYNDRSDEEHRITYTDYVALMMSSVSTIINAISYVLIAFVAISLVVSSIMIGIITYISVLERTREIGILRAIGASKRDVGRVFNAETLAVGFIAGLIGIGVTLLLTIPINMILHAATGISILNASLPVTGAVVLVIISMLLTYIAGLIPSGIAARKDPVIALRSE